MSPVDRRSAWAPWAGLFCGAGGWFTHQTFGADANYWDCHFGGPLWAIGLGLVCALIVVGGGWLSWTSRRTAGEGVSETRRFYGLVGTATAAIFLMAICFQTLAGLIVPSCLR